MVDINFYEFNIGDTVRSYDFEGSESYIEGILLSQKDQNSNDFVSRYEIRVTKRVVRGTSVDNLGEYPIIHTPVNGTTTLMGYICYGVELVIPDTEEDLNMVNIRRCIHIAKKTDLDRVEKIAIIRCHLKDTNDRDAGYFIKLVNSGSFVVINKLWVTGNKKLTRDCM